MYIIGIDVSKAKLHCGWLSDPQQLKPRKKSVSNNSEGFADLLRWAQHQARASVEQLHFLLEATGVYHEAAAEALHAAGARVSVINPLQLRRFAESHGMHTKNDQHDPRLIALYGHERHPEPWQPPSPELKHLRALLARLNALEKDIRRELNRREKSEITNTPKVTRSIDAVLKTLRAEHERLQREIDEHIDRHPPLKHDRDLLQSIPGIGEKLSARFVALFHTKTFTSAPQAAAYLGLAVVEHQSGSSIEKRPRLSKHGDPRMRAALYMPAIVATKRNPDVRALYQRLIQRGEKSKKAAIGAAMRKLVHIAFGVIKHQMPYEPQTT